MIKERRNKRNTLLNEAVAWLIPLDRGGKLKAGDYVAIDPTKAKNLINFKEIAAEAKRVKNIFYLFNLLKGMATLTRGKWSSTPKLLIPVSMLRAKIKGHLLD